MLLPKGGDHGGLAMDAQQREVLKQKAKIATLGIIAGGVAWWIVLANFLGWVSPTTAQIRTSDAVQTKVDEVLAPFCADRFLANKDALAKFTKADESYARNEIVRKAIPKIGSTEVDYPLSDSCTTAIEARLKSATPNVVQVAPNKS
jgi:hypothetical protein